MLYTSSQILAQNRLCEPSDWDAMVAEMNNRVVIQAGFSLVEDTQAAKLTNVPANTNAQLALMQLKSEKNIASGYAGLDSNGLIPPALLPSFVDDVIEVANFAALPTTGVSGKIYVTLNDNKTYRWSGSTYVEISSSPGTTDSLTEGSVNLYHTQARVRATDLAGLSTSTSSAVTSADTVLQGIGKLQAQFNNLTTTAKDWTANQTISNANFIMRDGSNNVEFQILQSGFNSNPNIIFNPGGTTWTANAEFHMRSRLNSSVQYAFLIQQAGGNNLFGIDNRGILEIGFRIDFTTWGGSTALLNASQGYQFNTTGNNSGTTVWDFNVGTTSWNSPAANHSAFLVRSRMTPTTNTGAYNAFELRPELNATGSYNGVVRGFYYNPTVTSMVASQHLAWEHTSGGISWNSTIRPAALSSNQNDYNPTGLINATVLVLDATTAVDITGLQHGYPGKIMLVQNISSFTVTLPNESTSSGASNRFRGNISIAANKGTFLRYDGALARWTSLL